MTIPSTHELIQSIIDECHRHPEKLSTAPTPIAHEALNKLTFPDGKPLPPSLKQWLAFDALSLGLLSAVTNPVMTPRSVTEWGGPAFNTLQRMLLPEAAYQLYPSGGDSMWFLYTGQADEEGEYPVFVADVDDRYYVRLFAPNFAVWLANYHKVVDFNLYRYRDNPSGYPSLFEHPDYQAAMRHQSQLNFHGYRYCEVYGEAVTAEGLQSKWCSEDDLRVDLRQQGFDDNSINQILGIDTGGL